MIKKKKVPKLRFPGFTDDWEQRKLLDCAGFRRGSFPQPYGNKEWYDGEGAMPFVQVADITDDMKLVNDTKQKISKTAQPMSVFAEEGSVLVTLQGSIGRVAITQYGAFVDRTVLIFDKYNQDIDKTFWAYIIKEKFIDEARKAPGGTVKTITKEALSDFDLMIPSYGEQKNLGTFLVSIDRLITLHQRKLEHTKDLKKSMLQKMFPKKGEKNPEIRFPGFTDTWEQRKVSEVTTSYSGGTPQAGNSEYYNGTIPFIRSGEIYEKHTELFITQKGLENSSAKMVSKGDILYALYGATSGEVSRSNINGAINQAILAITPNDGCNANFLVEWFRKEKESIIDKYLQGGQGNLSAQIIKKLEIPFPTFEEQNKIGRYFTELNRLITLHQRELEHLKLLKKGLLQQMFV